MIEKARRNREIIERYCAGESAKEMAPVFGISHWRVSDLIQEHRAKIYKRARNGENAWHIAQDYRNSEAALEGIVTAEQSKADRSLARERAWLAKRDEQLAALEADLSAEIYLRFAAGDNAHALADEFEMSAESVLRMIEAELRQLTETQSSTS